jgi:hypothetical protein
MTLDEVVPLPDGLAEGLSYVVVPIGASFLIGGAGIVLKVGGRLKDFKKYFRRAKQ